MHVGVFQGAQQVRAQARFKPQAGQLAWVEDRRHITHVGQGVVQGAAQCGAVFLQVGRHAPLQPVCLQLGGCQQLADIVMQFAAQTLAFALLHLEQAVGQLLGAHGDRARGLAQLPANSEQGGQLQCQQAAGHRCRTQVQVQVGRRRHQAQQGAQPMQQRSARRAALECLEA